MKIMTRISIGLILSVCAQFLYAQALSADQEELSDAELEQMLAPIALYPDTVLAHVLIAATYPLEVVQAERWSSKNANLNAEQALAAVENEDWDPSVKALVPFPDLLKRMSDDLDWTQRLGDAFLLSEERVMASVQSLRQRAYDAGNLSSLTNVDVSRDKEVIIIEPAVREVVYIPYYDTRYVYGDWRWSRYPPVYWHSSYIGHRSHSIYWGPRVHVSFGFFFSSFQWHHHHVVVVDHHYHNHRNRNFYNGRHVARHQNARHWEHNPHHRRGVVYRNPRTRDYFENRKRDTVNSRRDYVPRQEFNEQRRQQVTRDIREPRNRDQSAGAKDRRVRSADRVSDTRVRNNDKSRDRSNDRNDSGDNSALIEQRKQDFEKRKGDKQRDIEQRRSTRDQKNQRINTERRERIDVRQRSDANTRQRAEVKPRVEAKQRIQEPRAQRQQYQQERTQRQDSKNRYSRTESSARKQNNNRATRTESKERSADSRFKRER